MAVQTLDSIPAVDLLIVTRGGGSEEDLRTFNEEPIVRSVVETDTPVMVAIGHEMDRTLTGEAADYRAITPTDAGESSVPRKKDVLEQVETYREDVESTYTRVVEEHIDSYEKRLEDAFTALEKEHEHREEVEAMQRKYRIALIVLAVLFGLLLLAWVLL